MVCLEDFEENDVSYLCVAADPQAMANNVKQRFRVYPSMLRPDAQPNPGTLKKKFPKDMTARLNALHGGPSYVLKSTLKDMEEESGDVQPLMLGRRIITGDVRWGVKNQFRIPGEFTFIPLYWEWTEHILARFATRLKDANIDDAVRASLYSYDRDSNVMRAFFESWCHRTNTLHTIAGEWSISLWDLHELGGLPILGHAYDEAIPSCQAMRSRRADDSRRISRACEHLFQAYRFLADQPGSKKRVQASEWVQFWCKQEADYEKMPARRPRGGDTSPPNRRNPTGVIPKRPLNWTKEELEVFSGLEVDDADRSNTYLAAFLSCWLCVFVLPEDGRLVRPGTFEVATQMARGGKFSLAIPVLASIYHGLNKMACAVNLTSSGSVFPAHYLYGWLGHYFGTHHVISKAPPGPMMARYSGYQGAKYYLPDAAHKLIHEGYSFKASSLVLQKNKCETFCEEDLDPATVSYIISLRTAYLPLRCKESKTSFFLEPYHPTRFSRQFGFYQEIARELPRFAHDGLLRYDVALKHLKMLLFVDSQTRVTLPGFTVNWRNLVTNDFRNGGPR